MKKYFSKLFLFVASVFVFGLFISRVTSPVLAMPATCDDHEILICHANEGVKEYTTNCVDKSSTAGGHGDHADDIIPTYDYQCLDVAGHYADCPAGFTVSSNDKECEGTQTKCADKKTNGDCPNSASDYTSDDSNKPCSKEVDVKQDRPYVDDTYKTCTFPARGDQSILENGCVVPQECEEAEQCPAECGYEGGQVPDGECGYTECPATEKCEGEPTATPTPTPTIAPTPTVTSTPASTGISLGYNIRCEGDGFEVTADVKNNGNPVKDLEVYFTYGPAKANDKTNSEGRADTSFTKAGDGQLTAEASGYSKATIDVKIPTNCESAPGVGGVVLGASTETSTPRSQVLGASTDLNTFADTGASSLWLSLAGLTTLGFSFYRVVKASKI